MKQVAKLFYTLPRDAANWEFIGSKRGVRSKESGSLLRPKCQFGRLKLRGLYVLDYQVVKMALFDGSGIFVF